MEDTSFWVLIAVVAISILATLVYIAFLVFLPEWVGVTGKVALAAEKSHEEGSKAEESGFAKGL